MDQVVHVIIIKKLSTWNMDPVIQVQWTYNESDCFHTFLCCEEKMRIYASQLCFV